MSLTLITGGAGFIGSHLADSLLADGHQVRVLDDFSTGRRENLDPRCVVLEGDVADPDRLGEAMHGVVGCFHLAAIASVARGNEDWTGTHRVNQTATIRVFEAARDAGHVPVVYASSAAIYGDLGTRIGREDLVPAPRTAYGADKLGSEHHGRVAAVVHGVPTLGLRFFNIYGPRQDPLSPYSGVISIFAGLVAAADTVTVHGDGGQTRDFVYVSDVVAHLRAGMRHLSGGRGPASASVFNVCTGRGTSVLGLAQLLGRLQGIAPRIEHGPERPGDIRQSVGDPAAASSVLNVRAEVPLEAGLRATLAWMTTPAAA